MSNRFQDFFEEEKYVFLKNYLYNYLLRKRAVEKNLAGENPELILEVGSGLSPIVTVSRRVIYSDLSFAALNYLKRAGQKGFFVVADATALPFKPDIFSHAICSEVLEHIEDDQRALNEMGQVLKLSGNLILTFPHRKFYFANDDRFVNHYRRYETHEMLERLETAGLKPLEFKKILGPLEKITMSMVVFCFSILPRIKKKDAGKSAGFRYKRFYETIFKYANRLIMGLVWLDAKFWPAALSTIKLVRAEKIR
jgi:ubiquinone/menaquinone biosynthesis C-methylase UbiE